MSLGKAMDLTGHKYGRLKVLEYAGRDSVSNATRWKCECICGNISEVVINNLRSGATKSCGCLRDEVVVSRSKTHGMSGTRLHDIWKGIRKRCINPNANQFKDYGGREINICDEWDDFIKFHDWAMSNGYEEDLTIDRIDNNGDYTPDNCRWVTHRINNNNRRDNIRIEHNGIIRTASEWAEHLNINYRTIKGRYSRGYSTSDILSTKCLRWGNDITIKGDGIND